MMLLKINKKVLVYIFFFIFLTTLNNKFLLEFKFNKISEINIHGLNQKENTQLLQKLNIFKNTNIFSLNKTELKEYLDTNNLIESYTILKRYPSSIEIRIVKTNFLARVFKEGKTFYLGSNGKLIQSEYEKKELPNIFGDFNQKSFFELYKSVNESKFQLSKIKNLYFFKSGRWDIETYSGILIKIPNEKYEQSLKFAIQILKDNQFKNIKEIDLRQKNQVILNEQKK